MSSSAASAAPRPTGVFVELLPGLEVAPSRTVNLFARAVIAAPVGGSASFFEEEGAGLPSPPALSPAASRVGAAAQVGLTVRVGPLWSFDDRAGGTLRVDDEP